MLNCLKITLLPRRYRNIGTGGESFFGIECNDLHCGCDIISVFHDSKVLG